MSCAACRVFAVCSLLVACGSSPGSPPPAGGPGGSGGSPGGPPATGGSAGGAGVPGNPGGGSGGTPTAGTGGAAYDSGSPMGGQGGDRTPDASTGGAEASAKDSAPASTDAPPAAAPLGGCAGGTCLNPNCMALTTPAAINDSAEIDFDPQPSFIPNDVIVPTFDDVPDDANVPPNADFGAGEWTKKLVQYLDANNLHFDFFINTNNFCDVMRRPGCMQTLTSILKTQNPGNHTVHHISMGVDNPDFDLSCDTGTPKSHATCDAEMQGVEAVVNAASMGARPHLTRFRAPFGTPYADEDRRALAKIRPVVAKYAVHVGWQLDSLDSSCDMCHFTGQMIADNVTKKIGAGPGKGDTWGIILMHGVFPGSFDAAKILFDPKTGYAKAHNFRLGTVEDVICWKYGKHSWEIVQQLTGQPRASN